MVVLPNASDDAVVVVIFAATVDAIRAELTEVVFAVGKGKFPSSLFHIFVELAFVAGPEIFHIVEVWVVEWGCEKFRGVIVELSFSMELVILPLAFIGYLSRLVV